MLIMQPLLTAAQRVYRCRGAERVRPWAAHDGRFLTRQDQVAPTARKVALVSGLAASLASGHRVDSVENLGRWSTHRQRSTRVVLLASGSTPSPWAMPSDLGSQPANGARQCGYRWPHLSPARAPPGSSATFFMMLLPG